MTGARRGLLITLIDPVVATSEAASAGRPETLSYLPGAMLLGAVAGRAYGKFLEQGRAFDIFHSGALRFGDGLPLDEAGHIGFPAPASLHYPKGEEGNPAGAVNFARRGRLGDDPQMKQIRDVATTLAGQRVVVKKVAALKTAIDAQTGRARDAQLFGLEALASGQHFRSEISADDAKTLDDLQTELPDRSVLRLGRSRGAEYGRVRIEWTDAPSLPGTADMDTGPLLIWALSDIALDPEAGVGPSYGMAAALGLPDTIDAGHSFLRLRRVWSYNGHWGARGLERLVVQRGSVIALKNASAQEIGGWLGLHREIGCGRISVGPVVLGGEIFTPEAVTATLPEMCEAPVDTSGPTPVYTLLAARRGGRVDDLTRLAEVGGALEELGTCYARAADLAGTMPGRVGPGPAQWSGLRAALGTKESMASLLDARGIAREDDADWGVATGIDETFRTWLQAQMDTAQGDRDRIALLAKGASEAVAALRDGGEWKVRL